MRTLTPARWGATHVLSVEREGRMVPIEVRKEGSSLFTVLEWTGHETAEWTIESEGLCYCGEKWEGVSTLVPLPGDRLTLDSVLSLLRQRRAAVGPRDVAEIAKMLGREEREILSRIATLSVLGFVAIEAPDGKLDGRTWKAVH